MKIKSNCEGPFEPSLSKDSTDPLSILRWSQPVLRSLPWWLSRKRIRLPMQETVGGADSTSGSGRPPWRRKMATHSSRLAWKIPETEEPVDNSPKSQKESDVTEQLSSSRCRSAHPGAKNQQGRNRTRFSHSFLFFGCTIRHVGS